MNCLQLQTNFFSQFSSSSQNDSRNFSISMNEFFPATSLDNKKFRFLINAARRLEPYKCLQCGKEVSQKKCSCGNNETTRFGTSAFCRDCDDGLQPCFKCSGGGFIERLKWSREKSFFPRQGVDGKDTCQQCNGKKTISCITCRGKGVVYYRSSEWR